jgi:hypothetical protein
MVRSDKERIDHVRGTWLRLIAPRAGTDPGAILLDTAHQSESQLLCDVAELILRTRSETDEEADRILTNVAYEARKYLEYLGDKPKPGVGRD